ncbi:heavy-metal-associated domain-containing protein [bacterium]|nr:heavy-metal-associated domain-containing protein [bacterium]
MTCDHCVQAVTRALSTCDGVKSVEVHLASASAVVKGSGFDTRCLVNAVKIAGYEASISDNQ